MSLKNKKVLVAYFSHNKGEKMLAGKIVHTGVGNTEFLANLVQEEIGCDVFEIRCVYNYPYNHFDCIRISKKEYSENKRPELIEDIDIAKYDTIILGYPNWVNTMPMVVWTFLETHDFSGKTIIPYCTHEGGGLANSVDDIKKLVDENAIVDDGYAIRGSKVEENKEEIIKVIKSI